MEPRTVVAIEIASSKIKGAVGSVGSDGRLAVLAVEDAPAVNNVRYGRVQNIREVSEAIGDIIRKLEGAPAVAPRKIRGLVLSVGPPRPRCASRASARLPSRTCRGSYTRQHTTTWATTA